MAGSDADERAKVEAIRTVILDEARAEAERILAEAEELARQVVAATRDEMDLEAHAREEAAHREADRQRRARRAHASSLARTQRLAARDEVLRAAIDASREWLSALRERPSYPAFLKELLLDAAVALAPHDDLEVLFDARDEEIVTSDFLGSVEIELAFGKAVAVRFHSATERIITMGGVVVRVRGHNLRCDNTLEERLRSAGPDLLRLAAAEILGSE
jgi:V/A-type H+/Na+-transporting ATPase subunit E